MRPPEEEREKLDRSRVDKKSPMSSYPRWKSPYLFFFLFSVSDKSDRRLSRRRVKWWGSQGMMS